MPFHTLVLKYGLDGFFLANVLGSTIFIPFTSELLTPVLLANGVSPIMIVIYGAIGAFLGTLVNYGLGFYGAEIIGRHTRGKEAERVKRIMDKYGWFGVFIILVLPIPLPVDPLTVLCGLARMNILEFSITVIVAKIIKYSIAVGLFSLILYTL